MNDDFQIIQYGIDKNQFGRFYFCNKSNSTTVVLIIHGGFWKDKYTIDSSLIESLPSSLINEGYNCYVTEYRRVGSNGGWPNTNNDIVDSFNALNYWIVNKNLDINMNNSIIIGHSAGGTLALWLCCHSTLSKLLFNPKLCVAIAPIGDLEYGQELRLSDNGNAIENYMGHYPCDLLKQVYRPNCCKPICQYSFASPSRLLPLQVKTLLVSGTDDDVIFPNVVEHFYNKTLECHPDGMVSYICIKDANHFQLVDSNGMSWKQILSIIKEM